MAKGIKEQVLGQISLWDIEEIENRDLDTKKSVSLTKIVGSFTEKAEKITKLSPEVTNIKNDNSLKLLEITEEQQNFLKKNEVMKNENLSRIIKYCGGGLGIELFQDDEYTTLYINNEGIKEFNMKKSKVLPMDQVIYYKGIFKANELQEQKLEEIRDKALKIIRRKGDENIILETKDKVLSINSKGWILEFNNVQAVYSEDEVERKEVNAEISVGDTVEIVYRSEKAVGVVTRIYGPGNSTINVIFNGMHTSFYKGNVRKVY